MNLVTAADTKRFKDARSDSEPIVTDVSTTGRGASPKVQDGNHRLAAAIVSGTKSLTVSYVGNNPDVLSALVG